MIIIADAGPLLHLYWVGASAWALPPQSIDVVSEVWAEVSRHAPQALQDARLRQVSPSAAPPPQLASSALDPGELAALTYALEHRATEGVLVLCDEHEARLACLTLGIPVIGSIGLILEAFRAGRVSRATAETALRELPTEGRLHVQQQLIDLAVEALDDP